MPDHDAIGSLDWGEAIFRMFRSSNIPQQASLAQSLPNILSLVSNLTRAFGRFAAKYPIACFLDKYSGEGQSTNIDRRYGKEIGRLADDNNALVLCRMDNLHKLKALREQFSLLCGSSNQGEGMIHAIENSN